MGPAVADAVERLPDGRIRIASAAVKAGWNSSVTIGIDGQWFEVEREEQAQPPRPYVYVLRPAPPGKILRGYQQYPAATVETVAGKMPSGLTTQNSTFHFFRYGLQSTIRTQTMATSIAPIAPVDPPVIKAAGGILQRSTPRGDEVMVVYRKHHQDWTLPRGKVKDGESFQEAAMREVEDETGCSCRIGNYLGTISYSDNGVPKVVLFWKMTLVEEKGSRNNEQIGEALWLPVPAAIERLTHAQEKALLSRVGSIPKQSETPVATAVPAAKPCCGSCEPDCGRGTSARPRTCLWKRIVRTRVCCGNAKLFAWNWDFWSAAARALITFGPSRRMNSSTTYCAAWKATTLKAAGIGLHAAQRYAVFGMNQIELANRAHVLREESLKINSWRAAAMEGLLSGPEDQLTAENVADAIALRNEDFSHQHFKTRIIGDRLRVLLLTCGLAAIASAPFIFLPGRMPIVCCSIVLRPARVRRLLGAVIDCRTK